MDLWVRGDMAICYKGMRLIGSGSYPRARAAMSYQKQRGRARMTKRKRPKESTYEAPNGGAPHETVIAREYRNKIEYAHGFIGTAGGDLEQEGAYLPSDPPGGCPPRTFPWKPCLSLGQTQSSLGQTRVEWRKTNHVPKPYLFFSLPSRYPHRYLACLLRTFCMSFFPFFPLSTFPRPKQALLQNPFCIEPQTPLVLKKDIPSSRRGAQKYHRQQMCCNPQVILKDFLWITVRVLAVPRTSYCYNYSTRWIYQRTHSSRPITVTLSKSGEINSQLLYNIGAFLN